MNQKELYEHGIQVKPANYEIQKLFSPHSFVGSSGRNDTSDFDSKMKHNDRAILQKFYQRFPALNLMPQVAFAKFNFGNKGPQMQHPAVTYIKKFKELKKKGYNE